MPTATLVIDVQDDATASAEQSPSRPPRNRRSRRGRRASRPRPTSRPSPRPTAGRSTRRRPRRPRTEPSPASAARSSNSSQTSTSVAHCPRSRAAHRRCTSRARPRSRCSTSWPPLGGPIIVVDEQPYSFDELEARGPGPPGARRRRYPNVATGVNISGGGVIPVFAPGGRRAAERPEGDPRLRARGAARGCAAGRDHRPATAIGRTRARGVRSRSSTSPLASDPASGWERSRCASVRPASGPSRSRAAYRTTLVFEGDRVDWRPADRRIVFTDRRGATVRLSDGDRSRVVAKPVATAGA